MPTKESLFKWYNDLPPWARGLVVVGTLGIVTYTTYSIVTSINNKKKQQQAQAEAVGFVNDLNQLGTEGVNPNYQQSQYQTWADGIQQQFTGCDPTTSAIFADPKDYDDAKNASNYSSSGAYVLGIVLQMGNDADFLALQAAWAGSKGSRTISKHWYCGGDDTNVTLSAAIVDQLDTGEVVALNVVLNHNGISYTF